MTVLQTMSERQARAIVRERSGGRCEIAIPGVCRGAAAGVSHRIRRGQGGLWQPSNLLDACGSGTTGCHGWVTGRPVLAEAAGLAIPSYALTSWPAWCEPHGWHRGWWHPRDDGTWTECYTLDPSVGPWQRLLTKTDDLGWPRRSLTCDRPDAWREQELPHAELCDGLGACAA